MKAAEAGMVGAMAFFSCAAVAQPGGDYGIDFVTVGAAGNAAFNRPDFDRWPNSPSVGRGAVGYEFRIGKFEITTGQWLEFANAVYGRESRNQFLSVAGPDYWGAAFDPNYHGPGYQFRLRNVPGADMMPVYGISWRDAALYCNWLQNGKGTNPETLLSGAYDVSTWGNLSGGAYSDAPTHSADARFWIPTFDEQLKAMHYDPNRYGAGQGGWWLFKNGSDVEMIPGLPGVGQTSAGLVLGPGADVRDILLGAYTGVTSPWGLYDTSGGTQEWNEHMSPRTGPPRGRGLFGSAAGESLAEDEIYSTRGIHPGSWGTPYGFRIASSVPEPGFFGAFLASGFICVVSRRRAIR